MAAATERKKNLAARWRELPDNIHEKSSAERRRLWDALHELAKLEGGKVVSPPFHSPLRIEIDPDNTTLIPKLRRFGYTPATAGQVSVFDGKAFIKHDIVCVDLPSPQFLAGIVEK
jgi:hypothetical protein